MIIITYAPNDVMAELEADGLVEKTINDWIVMEQESPERDFCAKVGNFLYIDYLRLATFKGRIKPEQVKVLFQNPKDQVMEIHMSKDGRFYEWPEGFGDHTTNILAALINWDRKEVKETT